MCARTQGKRRPLTDFSHGALDSPFPHARFTGTGFQAARFQWALADELMRRDPVDGATSVPDRRFAHRQKSYVSPLAVRRPHAATLPLLLSLSLLLPRRLLLLPLPLLLPILLQLLLRPLPLPPP